MSQDSPLATRPPLRRRAHPVLFTITLVLFIFFSSSTLTFLSSAFSQSDSYELDHRSEILAKCAYTHATPGPPPHFHARTQSFRYAENTKPAAQNDSSVAVRRRRGPFPHNSLFSSSRIKQFDIHTKPFESLAVAPNGTKLQETIPNSPSPDDELPPRFFDSVDTNYPPRRSNYLPYSVLQQSAQQSRVMALLNRLPFSRQAQQARPSAERLRYPQKITQLLQQHLHLRRPIPSPSQPVNVAAAHGNERVIADGRLRMPPKWDLEPLRSSPE
ncbi:uncharacterized protein HD556DRAFT_1444658 [Suillus plorans]|uniref:Uncharacterized protein n=1 Tax=Suillus plorans TaxID=116603 RepID=A0A9P7ALS0_9AGAM|nr:uncharacterized protein HD556DRAFT_1444658 [Suillus plorans]KAG1792148.1 hypothetical protein HD556DRAFT_1444658 [Suillus plorans]